MVDLFRMYMNTTGITLRIRRKLILSAFLILTGLAPSLQAQSVWSGNASVDGTEFVNFTDDFPLAGASSSFTRNTKILVTNPENSKSVEVTVVKRAPRPGVFLVLSEEAGRALSISSDQVVPVQVQVVSADTSNAYDEFRSADPDINPAVSVPETETLTAETALDAADDSADTDLEILSGTVDEDIAGVPPAGDEPVPVPVPADSLRVEREEPVVPDTSAADAGIAVTPLPEEEILSGDALTAVSEPEVPAVSDSAAAETVPETAILTDPEDIEESLLPSGDNVIYFLTPSDFRPPTGPVTVKEDTEEIVPVLVDRNSLEKFIVNQLKNGSSYIQLGAYSSPESVYAEITAIADRYPMVVWTETGKNGTLYKLLIGPLTRDETGVLSYRFRSTGYADLFLYKP